MLGVGLSLSSVAVQRGNRPALDLDFLSGSLDNRLTFSRASAATFTGSDGLLKTSGYNLLTYSGQFDNAAWGKTNVTVAANATANPLNGAVDAGRLVENSANGEHYTEQVYSAGAGVAATYTMSAYVKAGERTVVQLRPVHVGDGPGTSQVNFNLTTKTFSVVALERISTYGFTELGGGWFRLWCVFSTTVSVTSLRTRWQLVSGHHIYQGDGASGLFIHGAQLEVGSTPSEYSPTTSVAGSAPRFDYDPVTLAARGLLIEESRSNLFPQSNAFSTSPWFNGVDGDAAVTVGTATAPNGTTAFLLNDVNNTTTLGRRITGAVTSSANPYTASLYLKAGTSSVASIRVDLGGGTIVVCEAVIDLNTGIAQWRAGNTGTSFGATAAGNGWYRLWVTLTDNASGNTNLTMEIRPAFAATVSAARDPTLTGSVHVFGAQAEAGSFPTSYMPTTTTAVTRSADVCSMATGSWFNSAEGTLAVEASRFGLSAFGRIVQFDDTTVSNAMLILGSSANSTRVYGVITAGGVSTLDTSASATDLVLNTPFKAALAYKANDGAFAFNGTVITDTSVTLPTVTRLAIGNATGGIVNGHVRKVRVYASRLPDATLQAITA